MASWRRYPPTHVALRRIESVLLTAHGLEMKTPDPADAPAVGEPPPPDLPKTEAELDTEMQRMVGLLNRQFAGRLERT